ncbi:MAG: hypothetical protein LBU34_03470 [Planctomycetaceae bacterium]|nr:hypothetical protein [Planctomycetaceae bacterium]
MDSLTWIFDNYQEMSSVVDVIRKKCRKRIISVTLIIPHAAPLLASTNEIS